MEVARRCSGQDKFRLRCVSKCWEEATLESIEVLFMRWHPELAACGDRNLRVELFTQLRKLSLCGARGLESAGVGDLIRRSPSSLQVVDLRFALPLSWPAYEALQRELALAGRHLAFEDTLGIRPNPGLTPQHVAQAQCYALHCGRVDVCFAFASPQNKANTGPLSRFQTFFAPPSPYAVMLHCDKWELWADGQAEFSGQGPQQQSGPGQGADCGQLQEGRHAICLVRLASATAACQQCQRVLLLDDRRGRASQHGGALLGWRIA